MAMLYSPNILIGQEPGLGEGQGACAVGPTVPLSRKGTPSGKTAVNGQTSPFGRDENRGHAVGALGVAPREAVTQERWVWC